MNNPAQQLPYPQARDELGACFASDFVSRTRLGNTQPARSIPARSSIEEVGQRGRVDPSSSGRRRRRLAPSEKYELYLQVLTGQATQRDAAERWKVGPFHGRAHLPGRQAGRVGRVGRVGAGPARPDRGPGGDGRGPGGDRAAPGDGHRAGRGHPPRGGKSTLGLSAGPVPSRVDACVKAGLLDLVDHAVDAGWSPRRAAARLGIDDSRLARWQHRRDQRGADRPGPGRCPAARPAGRRTGRDPGVVHRVG